MERIRDKVRAWFTSHKGIPTKEELGHTTPYSNDMELFRETEEVFLLSALTGMDHASSDLDLADDDLGTDGISFEEASSFLKTRLPMTSKEWYALEPKVRFRAFTVAALSEVDSIDRVKQRLLSTIEKGGTLEQFWNAQKVEEMGGLAGRNPMYWETVYRTNMQTSYNAGRAMEFQRTQPEYLEFVGVQDERQTDICAKRSGIILPATHGFWKSNWPPLHFNCRSTVRPVPIEEVEYLREQNPEWERTPDRNLPIGEDLKGFGENPLDAGSFYKITPSMAQRIEQNTELKNAVLDFAVSQKIITNPMDFVKLVDQKAFTNVGYSLQKVEELRVQAKAVMKASAGKKIFNPSLDGDILVSGRSIKEIIHVSASPSKLIALKEDFAELISKAVVYDKEPSTKPGFDLCKILRVATISSAGPLKNRQLQIKILKSKNSGEWVLYDISEYVIKKPR